MSVTSIIVAAEFAMMLPRKPRPVQRGGAAQAYAASGNRFIGAEMELIR